jgi:hypothetical protein
LFIEIGKAAIDAINVYHAACYYGFPIEDIEDELTKKAYYGIIRTYGQVPKVRRQSNRLFVFCFVYSNLFLAIIFPTSSSLQCK